MRKRPPSLAPRQVAGGLPVSIDLSETLTPTTVLAAALGLSVILLLVAWRRASSASRALLDANRRTDKERERVAVLEFEMRAAKDAPRAVPDVARRLLADLPDALREIGRANGQRDLAEAVGRALERLLQPHQWMVFLDVDGEGEQFALVAAGTTLGRTWPIGATLNLQTGRVGLAMRRRTPLDADDLAAEPPIVREQVDETEPREFVVDLAVPLIVGDRVVGAATVGRCRLAAESARSMVAAIAEQAGACLRLLDVRDRVARLENEDEVTGLANRNWFSAQASESLFRNRERGVPMTVGVVGIDDFRAYSGREGAAEARRLLQAVARHMRPFFERGDLLCRWADDEFALLLPGRDKASATVLIDDLRGAIASQAYTGSSAQPAGHVTLSAGLATTPDDGVRIDELLDVAYRAYQTSRARGGDATVNDLDTQTQEQPAAARAPTLHGAIAAAQQAPQPPAPQPAPEDDVDVPAAWRV